MIFSINGDPGFTKYINDSRRRDQGFEKKTMYYVSVCIWCQFLYVPDHELMTHE
jgi:hypothetical protein